MKIVLFTLPTIIQGHNNQSEYQFSVPQIECTLGGTSKIGSHVYFLLIVAMVLLLWRHIVLLWRQDNISINNSTIWQNNSISQKTCNRKYTWLPVLLLPPWWIFYLRYWELFIQYLIWQVLGKCSTLVAATIDYKTRCYIKVNRYFAVQIRR